MHLSPDNIVIFPYAKSASHTVRVRMTLPADTAGLHPGMFVKSGFIFGHTEKILVPRNAVVYRSEVTAVYVVNDMGTVSLRQVRLGRRYDAGIEVLSGLQAGETIALDPVRAGIYLKEH